MLFISLLWWMIFLLRNKTDVSSSFRSFLATVERQFDLKVKVVHRDNDTKFKCMETYFDECGILFQTSCVGTPQQNGRVERKRQHILNVIRALMFQANLPVSFWGECVLTTIYLPKLNLIKSNSFKS